MTTAPESRARRSDQPRREPNGPEQSTHVAHYVLRIVKTMQYAYYGCLVLVAVLHEVALSVSTGKNHNEEEVTTENVPTAIKRQANFQNQNYNPQQISQEYFDFIQQTDATGNVVPRPPPFRKQNAQDIFAPVLSSDVFPPMTTTTLSPFATQQVQLQEEYARRTLAKQQTALTRPHQTTFAAQQLPLELQDQLLSVPRQQSPQQSQQPQSLRFLDIDGQVRQQNLVPQQQNFALQQQDLVPQQQDVMSQQQDFMTLPQRQDVAQMYPEEAFSYAQIQFGSAMTASRPKGQRSVSRPRNNQVVVEPIVQQTVDYPSAPLHPEQFSVRLLQNVVYVQPNGQMYKPVEDTESVVHIPRKNRYPQQQWPIISDGPTTGASSTSTTTAAADTAEEEQVVLIPRPKKLDNQRSRHEGRKSGRTQQLAKTNMLQQPQYPIQQQQQEQSSEIEPDDFLASLLSGLQTQRQQQVTTVSTVPKARGGQRSKSGNRSGASKYLPDSSQLQLLQFPYELKSLSTTELKALEEASVQIADANDRSVFGRQKQLLKNRPVQTTTTVATTLDENDAIVATSIPVPAEFEELHESWRHLHGNNRPVPMHVQLNEQQRQFLAAQGIRHLYRVDYDQSGNVLPLTYVLALDNRPNHTGQKEP